MSTVEHRRELAAATENMRALVETLPLVVYTAPLDEKVRPIFIAPQVEELLGIPAEEFTFALLLAGIHPDDRAAAEAQFQEADRNQADLTIEYRWVRPDGRVIWLEDASRVVAVGGEHVAQGYLLDVTERKKTEQVLARRTDARQHLAALGRESLEGATREQVMRGALAILRDDLGADVGAIMENTPEGLVVVDCFGWDAVGAIAKPGTPAYEVLQARATLAGPTTFANKESLLFRSGIKSTIGTPILIDERDTFGVVTAHSHLEDAFDESQLALVEQVANLIGAVVARERHDARTQMSQRLEAVGQLAAGIAHDFNNMLTVISGYAGFALNHVDAQGRAQLEHVLHAAERAGTLTAQLLAFSRRQMLQRRPIHLAATVGSVLPMLRTTLGENVEVVEVPGDAIVLADEAQLENVLVNLAFNARDAMPRGGRLTIRCETAEVGEQEAQEQEVPPGSYGVLSVSDTGVGMPADVLARVFEPFFTTKDPGEGTGLGLAGVYGTIRQSGGFVSVESEVGEGTTFRIHLPAAAAVEPPGREVAVESPAGPARVLLVEDEEIVRKLLAEQLERAGHRVLPTPAASEALQVLAREPVDVVVSDVGLPGLGGATLAELVRERHPGIGVLLISGYPGDLPATSPALAGVQLLQKPFTARELERALAAVLA
ncbi:MAG TPA: ATP-binding protein [Gaiellaceae bacterium]|nr:ATP-binding protein [Gaiellaceae bacterium]